MRAWRATRDESGLRPGVMGVGFVRALRGWANSSGLALGEAEPGCGGLCGWGEAGEHVIELAMIMTTFLSSVARENTCTDAVHALCIQSCNPAIWRVRRGQAARMRGGPPTPLHFERALTSAMRVHPPPHFGRVLTSPFYMPLLTSAAAAAAALILSTAGLSQPAHAAELRAGAVFQDRVVRVVDGDTLILSELGRVRMIGAPPASGTRPDGRCVPPSASPCGRAAAPADRTPVRAALRTRPGGHRPPPT